MSCRANSPDRTRSSAATRFASCPSSEQPAATALSASEVGGGWRRCSWALVSHTTRTWRKTLRRMGCRSRLLLNEGSAKPTRLGCSDRRDVLHVNRRLAK
jgi:hypothetical protein